MPPPPARLARATKARLRTVQDYFSLAGRAIGCIFARPFYGQDVIQQMDEMGSSLQLATFGATMYIGRLVSASLIRELGPVLAGLMVAGAWGSRSRPTVGEEASAASASSIEAVPPKRPTCIRC